MSRATAGMTVAQRLEYYSAPDGECRSWTGSLDDDGYGRLWWRGDGRKAHRISWQLANDKKIPAGMSVCHRCDNRRCINPLHLFLGTPRENTHDMLRKGREAKGERAGPAKLTAKQVIAIRGDNRLQKIVAEEYRISVSSVAQIQRRISWRHLP